MMARGQLIGAFLLLLISSTAFGAEPLCPSQYVRFEPDKKSGDRISFCGPTPMVVAEFNRHNVLQIVLVGDGKWPDLGGNFFATDGEYLVELLVQHYRLKIIARSDNVVQLGLTGLRKKKQQ